jgi:hypothetical protein
MGLVRLVYNVSVAKLKYFFYLLIHVNNSYTLGQTLICNHVTAIWPFYEPLLIMLLVIILSIMFYRQGRRCCLLYIVFIISRVV